MTAARAKRSADRLRVAVCGLGIGRSHVKGLLQAPAVADVVALCDPDTKRLKLVGEEFAVAARYTDFAQLLAREKPDAVVVATPNHLHEPMTVAALEAGCAVLCEKPLAHHLASARRIAAAARKAKQLVMLDLSFRFTAAARTVKRWIDSGACGRLYHASTYWCRARGQPSWSPWFFDRKLSGGGPVIDLGVHRIDLALWFLGEPKVLSAAAATHGELGRKLQRAKQGTKRGPTHGAKHDRAKHDVEDFGGGMLRLAGGRSLLFEVSWAENSARREVMLTRILGVDGGAQYRNIDHTYEFVAELFRDRAGKLVPVDPKSFAQATLVPVREFVRAVATGARDVPDVETGLRLATVLEAIYRSAREGREVALAELEE